MDFLLAHQYSFIYGLVVFLVFIIVFGKLAIGPIVKAVDNRDRRIAEQLDEAEQAYARARELKAGLDEQLSGAEAKIAEMIREGRRDAEATKQGIIEAAQGEAAVERDRLRREIEAARYEAVVAVRREVAEIATEVAGKILDERLDAQRHQDLVGAAIEAFESKSGSGGGGGGGGGA